MFKKNSFIIAFLLSAILLFEGHVLSGPIKQKAVMIIASSDFRDEELLLTKGSLETNRIEVVIASSSRAPSRGMLGTVIRPDMLIEDINVADYDAVIFVGGQGAKEFWNNQVAHNIAIEAQKQEKFIGAIWLAPVTLARAGLLKNKKATVFSSASRKITDEGAKYTAKSLEIDGNIITAEGPEASREFGDALAVALVRKR